MTTAAVELAGWAGSALVLGAYLLVSMARLSAQSVAFQWMNVIGAIGLTINSLWHGAIPPAALDAAWALVGAVALARIAAGARRASRP